MSESVHVQRKPYLPDGQIVAIVYQPDGSIVYFIREDHISADGALALEAILTASRNKYHRQWGLPRVTAA